MKESKLGSTPLHQACVNGHTECALMLINAKACVHAKNLYGRTPLHQAAYSGVKVCVHVLLAAGAQVDQMDNIGQTALNDTFRLDKVECAEVLFDAGARMSLVLEKVPDWMQAVMAKRSNFRRAYVALYGSFFKRCLFQSSRSEPGFRFQKDVARLICDLVRDTRFHNLWASLV